MFWAGMPGMINAGADAVKTGVNAVDKVVE